MMEYPKPRHPSPIYSHKELFKVPLHNNSLVLKKLYIIFEGEKINATCKYTHNDYKSVSHTPCVILCIYKQLARTKNISQACLKTSYFNKQLVLYCYLSP